MSYRKLKADYLFDGFKMHQGAVLICGPDGIIEDIQEENQVDGEIEKFSGLLSPGFINCHCHLELSHLKGLIHKNQGLVNFLFSVISQRNQSAEFKQDAMQKAEADMLAEGIVAVGDICNTVDTLVQKSAKRLDYYNFIEVLGWAPDQAVARFENGKRLAFLFSVAGEDESHLSLSPHAPYSISTELWNLLKPGFNGKTITIHNQESAAENEFFVSGTGDLTRMYALMKIDSSHFKAPGSTSLTYYLNELNSASPLLLVHNTYTQEADLMEIRPLIGNLFFCLCPNANLYIENRLPDIPLFMKYGLSLVLGTDSLASNEQLSILEEMKAIKRTYPLTTTGELLLWATSNGAKALNFQEKLGDFTKGKKPGIVLIENMVDGEITQTSTSRKLV